MPDITMCSGQDCPIAEQCYRFTATPDPGRQAYFAKPPLDALEDRTPGRLICNYFMPLEKGPLVEKLLP